MLVALNTISTAAAGVPWPQLVAGSVITALVGLVALGLRSIVKGDLVPRKVVEDIEERADSWEASWHDSQATYKDLSGRLDAVSEGLRTIERALTAVTEIRKDRT